MQYHSTSTLPDLGRYFIQLDTISQLTPTRWSISPEQISLIESLENPFSKQQERIYDTQIIKADALIRHIDNAFSLYDSAIWCKGIDFETFCEYLLPYRVADESLDLDWMQFYREKVEERIHKAVASIVL